MPWSWWNAGQIKRTAATCLTALCAALPATGATDGSLLDIPFEQLSEIVVTPARTPQRVLDTPGVISTITAEEIRAFGANTLLEVVERLPGVTPLTGYVFDTNALSIRGDLPNQNDTHLLILINGRPFRGGFTGGFNGQLLNAFPVGAIERIELIRGPGSVLYGSNAFSGVLNIITREAEESHASIKLQAGSFGTRTATARAGHRGERGGYDLTLQFRETDGWNLNLTDENGVRDGVDKGERTPTLVFTGNYGGFSLNAYLSNSTATHLGPSPRWPAAEIDRNARHIALAYVRDLDEVWKLSAALAHTRQYQLYPITDVAPPPRFTGESSESFAEIYASRRLGDRGSWLTGGSFTKLRGDIQGASTLPHYDLNWWNIYSQASLPVGERYDLYLGAQYSKAENVDSVISPRLGGAYRIDGRRIIKLLYAEAFRSPFPAETGVQADPILVGNPDLEPELARTVDLRYRSELDGGFWAVGLFHTRFEDIVVRTPPVGGSPGTFVNQGKRRLQGVELEGKYRVTDRLALQGSATYQENRDENGVDDINLVPRWRLKAGIVYEPTPGLTLGLFDNYASAFEDVRLISPGRAEVNPQADAHHLLSLNVEADLPQLLPGKGMPDVTVSLYATNLLDEDIYVPEYTRGLINTLPARAGRGVYLSLEYRFD